MDNLKEYLQLYKAELDVDSPAGDTWEHIESKLPVRSGLPLWVKRLSVAACVIALVGAGLWLVIQNKKATSDTVKNNGGAVKMEPSHEKPKIETAVPPVEKAPGNEVVQNIPKPGHVRHRSKAKNPDKVSNEVAMIDRSYASLIDYQLKKLRATPLYAENGSYFSFYVDQFKQMDQDEQRVRNAIKAYGLTDQFLDQLINVYQQKLTVLKNLQTEINKMNNKVKEKQGRSNTTEVHYLDI